MIRLLFVYLLFTVHKCNNRPNNNEWERIVCFNFSDLWFEMIEWKPLIVSRVDSIFCSLWMEADHRFQRCSPLVRRWLLPLYLMHQLKFKKDMIPIRWMSDISWVFSYLCWQDFVFALKNYKNIRMLNVCWPSSFGIFNWLHIRWNTLKKIWGHWCI